MAAPFAPDIDADHSIVSDGDQPSLSVWAGFPRDLPGWETSVAKYLVSPGDEVLYEYDFGDGWEHTVVLEAIVDRVSRKRYAVCVAGARACPPEDCGGVPGYEDLLEIMQDPDHEEYEETLQWLARRFEPEVFSPEKVKFDNPQTRWHIAFTQD